MWTTYHHPITRTYQPATDQREGRDAKAEVYFLSQQVERLLMITEAMWQIIEEKTNLTEDDLIERVEAIDLRDGELDGKVERTPPKPCPACGRKLHRRHAACMYCGQEIPVDLWRR